MVPYGLNGCAILERELWTLPTLPVAQHGMVRYGTAKGWGRERRDGVSVMWDMLKARATAALRGMLVD